MKRYLKYFRIPIIVIIFLFFVYLIVRPWGSDSSRTNSECYTEERVFDYADVLTDEEEESLRKLIAKTEIKKQADIIIVTLDESLEEYATESQGNYVKSSEYVKVFGEDFYEEYQFGYDVPVGTGTMLVDNWYREADGKVYSWMVTSGNVTNDLTAYDAEAILDEVLVNVDSDPYGAYCAFVNTFADEYNKVIPSWAILLVGVIGTAIFVGMNLNPKSGKKTTVASTYVTGGRPDIRVQNDFFINKVVTKRVIPKSNGGGGGHGGGGGGGFGGGGHSR